MVERFRDEADYIERSYLLKDECMIKPMLACEVDLDKINFPVYASTKYDGIRCIVKDGIVYSRSLKPIRNKYVQEILGHEKYNGLDGELVVGSIYAKDCFQQTTSGVMSEDGKPDFKFYVFDLWNYPDSPYYKRHNILQEMFYTEQNNGFIVLVKRNIVDNVDDLKGLLEIEESLGGEGLIVRNPNGVYKYGRSTPKEQYSVKLKFFEQDEFEVVGFEERYHNANEATINELGYTERSSRKDNLVPMNTLGSIILKYNTTTFKCGTGFTDEQRQEIWNNKDKYLGKLASVRYMKVGSKDLPRVPSFQGFRHKDDM